MLGAAILVVSTAALAMPEEFFWSLSIGAAGGGGQAVSRGGALAGRARLHACQVSQVQAQGHQTLASTT